MFDKTYNKGENQLLGDSIANDGKKSEVTNSIPWLMFFCALSADLPLITLGSSLVWGSSSVPRLRSNDTAINPLGKPITVFQTSIIISSPAFTSAFSLIICGKLSNLLGRKRCLIFHSFLFVVCLTSIAMATHIYVYYIFFFINGFNISGTYINSIIYNSEVADDKNRAWMGCLVGLCMPTGILLGFTFGTLASIKLYTLICAIPAFLFLLLSFFIVESPLYLMYKNKKTDAIRILRKLRKHKSFADIQEECEKLEELSLYVDTNGSKYCKILSPGTSRRALFISLSLCIFQQASGISTMLAFAGTIFIEAGASLSANLVSILMGVMQIIVNVIIIFLVDKVGRRRLILISILGCSLSTFLLGIYFYLKSNSILLHSIKWLPIVCALTFMSSYALGLGNITASYISELFSSEFRATGFAVAAVADALVAFLVNFAFPLLHAKFGIFACMFVYSVFSLVGFLTFFVILPETTGKSFNEIQSILSKPARPWSK